MRSIGVWMAGWVMLGSSACASSSPQAPTDPTATAVAPTITLQKSADSGQVDRVGPRDGALAPDGTNDLGFVSELQGPISALFLVAVDDAGKPSGAFQADTLIGDSASPEELGAKPGNGTSGLGVFEADKPLNTKEGALDAIGAGPHRLTLYIAPSAALAAGSKLRVYALRADNSLVAGETITN